MNTEATFSPSRPTRKRTVSVSSLSSVQSRITLQYPKAEPAIVTVHTRSHYAYGSFIPTPSARPGLDYLRQSSSNSKSFFRSRPTRLQVSTRPWDEEEGDSPLSSGFPSPTIPSFSRTTSLPLISSPILSSSTLKTSGEPRHFRNGSNELDPILAKLERKSKLLTKKTYCATCKKVGSGYPKCGRCDAMWCSRECRMVGGKRHVCSSRTR